MIETDSKDKALLIGNAAIENKADDVVILGVQKAAYFCDYFVISSAGSFKKTRAIAEHIHDSLAKNKLKPKHVEGKSDGQWILLDYGDVVAHIFYEEARQFYGLERLWGDADRISIGS
ncbi:ribosome silencing factor [Candidatus Omnitrophota bacterium]